ncbi:MAG: hypothetical protein H6563_11675 [Lewinellaceae bacterium]|nr:hypothetical protein [Lewinellaceae bacterium]
MRHKTLNLLLPFLLLAPSQIPAQILKNSLSAGLESKFILFEGDLSMAGNVRFLYSVKNHLAVGFGLEYYTSGSGEFDTRYIAFQPTIRLYFLNNARMQWLMQLHLGVFKLLTFDGTPGPSIGFAIGPRLSITKRLGLEAHLLLVPVPDGGPLGVSTGLNYLLFKKNEG